jgi:hypothetical protein
VLNAPVDCDPLADFVPDQSPVASQDPGLFVADHVIVAELPTSIGPAGFISIVTTGTSGGKLTPFAGIDLLEGGPFGFTVFTQSNLKL